MTTPTQKVTEGLQDCLSPHAIAAIAAYLQAASVEDDDVQLEINWLRDTLISMVGGEFESLLADLEL